MARRAVVSPRALYDSCSVSYGGMSLQVLPYERARKMTHEERIAAYLAAGASKEMARHLAYAAGVVVEQAEDAVRLYRHAERIAERVAASEREAVAIAHRATTSEAVAAAEDGVRAFRRLAAGRRRLIDALARASHAEIGLLGSSPHIDALRRRLTAPR